MGSVLEISVLVCACLEQSSINGVPRAVTRIGNDDRSDIDSSQ